MSELVLLSHSSLLATRGRKRRGRRREDATGVAMEEGEEDEAAARMGGFNVRDTKGETKRMEA